VGVFFTPLFYVTMMSLFTRPPPARAIAPPAEAKVQS
jgi:hypothetical protein